LFKFMVLCRTGSAPKDGKLFRAAALAAKRFDEFAVVRKRLRAKPGDLSAVIPAAQTDRVAPMGLRFKHCRLLCGHRTALQLQRASGGIAQPFSVAGLLGTKIALG